jgi:hypothetical protein
VRIRGCSRPEPASPPLRFAFHVSRFTRLLTRVFPLPDLSALSRTDKWFLSAGDGIIWAPPFPIWLHRPGFWDEAMIAYHPFAPLFSVALIGPDGHEIPLERTTLRWRPGSLHTDWKLADGSALCEERAVAPGGRFVSRWTTSTAAAGSHLVAFTAQPGDAVLSADVCEDGVAWLRRLEDRRGGPLDVRATLTASPAPAAVAAVRSEPAAPQPVWQYTPFVERWSGGLRQGVRLQGIAAGGLVYAALDVPLGAGTPTVVFTLTVAPLTEGLPVAPVGGTAVDVFAERFPDLACDDAWLERYYAYRIYGLHLNRLAGGLGHVRRPAIAEGIGYFHVPITYSAQCHMFEMRWARDPDEARGSLLNFLDAQKPDGSFHGRLYSHHLKGTDFYHANWGDAVLAVDAVASDAGFLERAYDGLSRYARWLDATRDRERSGMYDVVDQFETGQEYMARYQAVDPDADRHGWENRIRLKGIDVTVYTYQLHRALEAMALRLERARQSNAWRASADRIGDAILSSMWDAATGLFSDVDPRTMRRTGVKAAVCFYPLLTDLLDDDAVRRLLAHLADPATFATPFPVPSSSLDDPLFNADAEWKGRRHNCPWNGRVWPMTNSHILEGLLRQWHRGRSAAGSAATDLLRRFVRLMFHERDLDRPNCYEHYNPLTGHASVYRGIDDYQHSWVLDPILRGITGIEPADDGLRIRPLPGLVTRARVGGLVIRGRTIGVDREGDAVVVTVDGQRHDASSTTPLELAW